MNPLISIIIPCYNQAQFLPETLQSVIDQTYTNWECVIVNDGSSDNTEEVANRWVEKDRRFRYYYKENSGLADTRNYAIKHAEGEYILPLDSDDKIGLFYIKEALNVFEGNPETKLVYSNLILFGSKNERLKLPKFEYSNLLQENQIFCSAIYRKGDYLKTDGYSTNMKYGLEDWDFWLRLIQKDDVVVKLDDFHFFYRIKEVSMLSSLNKERNEAMLLQIFKNNASLFLENFNPIRDHIEADYYKKEVESYKNSAEYRIGRIVYSPFRLATKIFNKIFR